MSGYIGPLPVPQGIQRKQSFTATASQTTFNTNGYTDGDFINVYLNGVRLINGTDYTATNGSDIVLTTGASASDVLDFETFDTFELVDQQFENVTLKNPTHEDTDGGRESAVSFKGEQSGGEISTLAQIQASHDGTSDDQKGDLIFKTNDGSDNDAPTEAARIDSGQNFLVSTTGTDPNNATSSSDAGAAIRSDGRFLAGVYQDFVADLNRIDNDGEIVRLSKDGTTVGSIGVNGSNLYIGSPEGTDAYIGFGNQIVRPVTSAGASRDNAIDLGYDGMRFKDLYLSGGAYIGGTVAANKLDDYEEGTWTPTIAGGSVSGTGTYSSQTGSYTKIGRMVHLTFDYGVTAHTGSGTYNVTGLPFTVGGQTGLEYTGTIMIYNYNIIGSSTAISINLYTGTGSSSLRLYSNYDDAVWQANNLDGNHSAIGSITFYV